MKTTLITLMFLILAQAKTNPITKTNQINGLKKKAEKAYINKDYKTAKSNYQILVDSIQLDDDNLKLNYAHASYISGDTAIAKSVYRELIDSKSKEVASIANQQLGVEAQQSPEEALEYFKTALRKDPSNEGARYNYEALKKKIAQQQTQQEKNEKTEPSEFAKALKKKAEELVAESKYLEGFNLMQQGQQKDQTVQAFSDFISRLKNVAEVVQQ